MTATIKAVTPAEYERFIARRERDIRAANEAAARQRRDEEGAAPQGPDAPQTEPSGQNP